MYPNPMDVQHPIPDYFEQALRKPCSRQQLRGLLDLIADFQKISPDDLRLKRARWRILCRLHYSNQVADEVRAFLRRNPVSAPWAWAILGEAYLASDSHEAAVCFSKAILLAYPEYLEEMPYEWLRSLMIAMKRLTPSENLSLEELFELAA